MAQATRKLLIVTTAAYPLGGVAVWTHSLLQGLSVIGWDCWLGLTIGVHCDPAPYQAMHPWPQCILIENKTGSREGRIRTLQSAIRKVRPDCVIVLNTPDAYIAASRFGAARPKVVMALHGIEPQFYEDLKLFSEVIDVVCVPSRLARYLVENLSEYPPERTARIPAGVDVTEVELLPPSSPLDIVYSGRLEQDSKRVRDIPPILRCLDDWGFRYRFLIAGNGSEQAFLASELATVRGDVQLLGTLSRDQLFNEVYRPGRVLLITSERETGPLVAWEAMSRGMLVVSSRYKGLKAEQLLHHDMNALLFPVGDHQAAAVQLTRASLPKKYRELAANGLALVRRELSMGATLEAWDSMLSTLLDHEMPSATFPVYKSPPDGRLSKALGNGLAETVRHVLRRRYSHQSAGGEWPHAYGRHEASIRYEELVEQIDSRSSFIDVSNSGSSRSSP